VQNFIRFIKEDSFMAAILGVAILIALVSIIAGAQTIYSDLS